MEWTGPQSPCLAKDGPFGELQVKDKKSAATSTVFLCGARATSHLVHFCYMRSSGSPPLDR